MFKASANSPGTPDTCPRLAPWKGKGRGRSGRCSWRGTKDERRQTWRERSGGEAVRMALCVCGGVSLQEPLGTRIWKAAPLQASLTYFLLPPGNTKCSWGGFRFHAPPQWLPSAIRAEQEQAKGKRLARRETEGWEGGAAAAESF